MKYYCEDSNEVLARLESAQEGLSAREADARLAKHGPNKLATAKKETLLQRFFAQLKDPMIIILLAAAAVSGITAAYSGESFADVFIILIVVLINAVLGVYQESKAEKAIEALQAMTAATSKVLRDGRQVSVKSELLVPGDVIVLEAGDAVPADARILESASLKAEEAALTGESVPVEKGVQAISSGNADVPLGDRHNMVYMGSTIVYGRGRAVITETGMSTEMGKIADALSAAEDGQTPLQIKLAQLSKILSWVVLGICIFIFAFSLLKAGDFHLDVVVSTFMVAVSLAVAAIPEGLATVVTIVLSIGVTNMSKRNAVIRRLTAVETLGCAQVICSDKTGTLTQNKMTVVDHYGDERTTAEAMTLCSDAAPDESGEAVYLLSRAAAQRACREQYLDQLENGSVIPCTVTHIENFGAFCDVGCGISALLPIDCLSVSRIASPADRVTVGQQLLCAIKNRDEQDRIVLTLRELLGTWSENAACFAAGETVVGIVRSVEDLSLIHI